MNPREAERKQVAQLLSLWDTRLLTALGGGGLSRFSELSPERRERGAAELVRQPRAATRGPPSRRCARPRCCSTTWSRARTAIAAPSGTRSGTPGPLGKNPDAPPKALRPLDVDGDTTLECDVVRGRLAARAAAPPPGVLAAAGLDVVVLEAGGYYDDEDFDGGELEGYGRMYMYGGGAATHDQSVGLLAGSCLGGGTVVNYTTSFRDARRRARGMGVARRAGVHVGGVRARASTRSASASA